MSQSVAPVVISLRIPGAWSHPKELLERLPPGCRLSPDGLTLPDGMLIDFGAVPADEEFVQIFRTSCRSEPTDEEKETIENYAVNVLLSGPGGSLEEARSMMRAAAAIVQAGGAGVFIDNCALAHGGQSWTEMAEDGGSDALSFAFVAIIQGKTEIWTMGMHVFGLPDIVMKREDVEGGGFDIVEVIRYVARGDKPIGQGHIIADLDGPRFQILVLGSSDEFLEGSPLYNPFGRLKLVSVKDIAADN